MTSLPDQLSWLLDCSVGLMTRLHRMIYFAPPPALQHRDMRDFNEHMLKKFPAYPMNSEKVEGFAMFKDRSLELATQLKDFYYTVSDVIVWREGTAALLEQMSKSFFEFQFESNHELCVRFLDLFTAFVQVHLLISRIPECRLYVTAYARAVHCTEGNTESNFGRLAKFLDDYDSNTIVKLQTDCLPFSSRVGEGILSTANMINKWSDAGKLRDSQVLNAMECMDKSNQVLFFDEHVQLMHMEKARTWILWGFLLCPNELQRPQALLLLRAVLSQTWFAPIFRDQYMEIHTPYRDLYTNWKAPSFDLSLEEHKQPIKDGAVMAPDAGKARIAARNVLRYTVPMLLASLRECSGLVGPRLYMMLSSLALIRFELNWYFMHAHYFGLQPNSRDVKIPFKTKGSFVWTDYHDAQIGELVYFADQLREIIDSAHAKQMVSTFYLEHAALVDAAVVRSSCEALARDPRVVSNSELTQQLNGVIAQFAAINRDSYQAKPQILTDVRTLWDLTMCVLSGAQNGVGAKTLKDICSRVQYAMNRTRSVDQLASLALSIGSLRSLWFWNGSISGLGPAADKADRDHPVHAALIDKVVASCLAPGGQPKYACAFLRAANAAMENVHRMCPEEQRLIGQQCVRVARCYLDLMTNSVDENLRAVIVPQLGMLFAQHAPVTVARMAGERHAAAESGKPAPVQRAPGYESQYHNRNVVGNLRESRRLVMEIAAALATTYTVVVFDTEFCTHELLLERMLHSVRQLVRGFVLVDKVAPGSPTIEPPTLILTRVRLAVQAFAGLAEVLNVDIHDVFKHVLLSEFSESNSGAAGTELVDPNEPDDKKPTQSAEPNCIQAISNWYTKGLFGSYFGQRRVFYSEYAHSFVVRDRTGATEQERRTSVERYMDVQELRALCTLCGPGGFRLMEREILHAVYLHSAGLREVLLRHSQSLLDMEKRGSDETFWRESVAKINTKRRGEESLPTDLSKAFIAMSAIGSLLLFRTSLQEALSHTADRSLPLAFDLLRQAHSRMHPPVPPTAQSLHDPNAKALSAVEQLCADVGLCDLMDTRLVNALSRLTSGRDGDVWNSLPELLGASLAAEEFSQAQYFVAEEGYKNNAQATIYACVGLIAASTAATLPAREATPQGLQAALRRSLQRLVRAVAVSLLTFKPTKQGLLDMGSSTNPAYLLPLYDYLIAATRGMVAHAYLERFFPYSLVRQNFVTLANAQLGASTLMSFGTKFEFEEQKDA